MKTLMTIDKIKKKSLSEKMWRAKMQKNGDEKFMIIAMIFFA